MFGVTYPPVELLHPFAAVPEDVVAAAADHLAEDVHLFLEIEELRRLSSRCARRPRASESSWIWIETTLRASTYGKRSSRMF